MKYLEVTTIIEMIKRNFPDITQCDTQLMWHTSSFSEMRAQWEEPK